METALLKDLMILEIIVLVAVQRWIRSKSMSDEELWFYLNQEVIEGRMSDADATQIWLEEQENE